MTFKVASILLVMDTAGLKKALQDAPRGLESGSASQFGTIEAAARYIAQHFDERDEIVSSLSSDGFDLWGSLGTLWSQIGAALEPSKENGQAIELGVALAKLERNLLAGSWASQEAAMPHEPAIRKVIFNVTTFTRIEDADYTTLQQVLAQLLCNLVSPNDEAAESMADTKLALYLSGDRDADVIIRLLDSRDARTNIATLHLLNNLTRCPTRLATLLCPTGVRWLSQLLGRMDDFHEHEDGRFDLCAILFNRIIDHGYQGELYSLLSSSEEAVTPSQVVLLKLVDASLAQSPPTQPVPPPNAFLLPAWRSLASYATKSMRSGKDDARLPTILAGLVLATEALSSIVVASQARLDEAKRSHTQPVQGGDEAMVKEMKGSEGIIAPLVEVLAATNDFLPRIKPAGPKQEATITAIDEEHEEQEPGAKPELEFLKVKRDLVRLLGVLAYEDVQVGDAIREAGGVQLVLGLCETDERNPYLREHALFAVRNLMRNNPANQAIIAQMEPLGLVGDDGELQPLPEKLKKSHSAAAAAAGAK